MESGAADIHKVRMLDTVAERYPARHYVMVDDKLSILAAMKQAWKDRVTTIFSRQGHYALDLLRPISRSSVSAISSTTICPPCPACSAPGVRGERNHEGD
jgi:phosphatidate phosphatase APP1